MKKQKQKRQSIFHFDHLRCHLLGWELWTLRMKNDSCWCGSFCFKAAATERHLRSSSQTVQFKAFLMTHCKKLTQHKLWSQVSDCELSPKSKIFSLKLRFSERKFSERFCVLIFSWILPNFATFRLAWVGKRFWSWPLIWLLVPKSVLL